MKGYIHSFESLAALDGEGLRCAVFFAGCHLRCLYCHNPDTWCGGESVRAEELVKKIARYKFYFGNDGGVTFSGGEPLLQAEFIEYMLALLEKESIKYSIDTSGAVKLTSAVKNVLSGAQNVLLDLKFWDDDSYLKYTRYGIADTLNMLKYLESINKKTWIRTVVVPGINDSEEIMDKYLELTKDMCCIEKYQLLAFHTMGFYKYEELGRENKLILTPPLDIDVKNRLQKYVDTKRKK